MIIKVTQQPITVYVKADKWNDVKNVQSMLRITSIMAEDESDWEYEELEADEIAEIEQEEYYVLDLTSKGIEQ